MKVVDPGHSYLLDSLDGGNPIPLIFVKREGPKYPGNRTHHPGTNMQEVMRALIERCQYVYNQIPNRETEFVIENLRICIIELERRAADRHGRELEVRGAIDKMPTCKKCGHIGCEGECRQ